MDEQGKTVLKPVRGHHGEDVIGVEKKGKYLVHIGRKKLHFRKQKLLKFVENLMKKRPMLVQKFIECRLKTGEPYDFRLHLQKNREGKWTATAIFPRIGSKERLITNLSQGSQMVELASFLRREFGDEGPKIGKQLEEFALGLWNILSRSIRIVLTNWRSMSAWTKIGIYGFRGELATGTCVH